MTEIETHLDIAAPQDAVWAALLRRDRWSRGADLLDLSPARPLVEGGHLLIAVRLLGPLPLPLWVRVVTRREGAELLWRGRGPGLVGEHYFRLAPTGEGWTHLVHGETFHGPLARAVVRTLGPRIRRRYEAFNAALALQAEAGG